MEYARRPLLFITHNLALVQEVAANVVVLDQGRVVEQGPTDRVLAEPATEYTRQLLADAPVLDTGHGRVNAGPS